MPRKDQKLTIEQIDEIISGRPTEETWSALVKFLKAERSRRIKAGNTGGKPKKYDGDEKQRRKEANRKYYERRKKNLANK